MTIILLSLCLWKLLLGQGKGANLDGTVTKRRCFKMQKTKGRLAKYR